MAVSGTIILCERVYTLAGGGHVIAGTHSQVTVPVADFANLRCEFPRGLNLYIRFSPERGGATPVEVRIKDERRTTWDECWLKAPVSVPVPDPAPRLIEMAFTTPPFHVALRSTGGESERTINLRNSIEVQVDGHLVATTPFDVTFVRQPPPG